MGVLSNDSIFFLWRCDPTRVMASLLLRFLDHTQRRTTVGRISLDEWSARRRDVYLTADNTHNRQTSMPPVEFEPTILAGERPQTYALDRAATWTGPNDSITIRKDDICDLLGYYVAYSHNSFPTFRDNLSVPTSMIKKFPGAHRHCLLRGGSLKSRTSKVVLTVNGETREIIWVCFIMIITNTWNILPYYQRQFVLTLRRLMSYIYGAPILDVSRSHTTTQHIR